MNIAQRLHGRLSSLHLYLQVFRLLSPSLREGASFRVYPVLLNVGINAEAALGQMTGADQLEKELHADAVRDLGSYLEVRREDIDV